MLANNLLILHDFCHCHCNFLICCHTVDDDSSTELQMLARLPNDISSSRVYHGIQHFDPILLEHFSESLGPLLWVTTVESARKCLQHVGESALTVFIVHSSLCSQLDGLGDLLFVSARHIYIRTFGDAKLERCDGNTAANA